MENKKVILFSQDSGLINLFLDFFQQGGVESYLFDKPFTEINFTNSVAVIDYDNEEGFDTSDFLSELVRHCGPGISVIALSKDCERRNISDVAKRGAARFIVKPLNKKRIKKFILPYVALPQVATEAVQ
ncbi:MAG: hypothetical protein V1647_00295 [Pseudomonadota bacterium]